MFVQQKCILNQAKKKTIKEHYVSQLIDTLKRGALTPHDFDAGPIEIIRRYPTRIHRRSHTTSLRVRRHVRGQARRTGDAHATLKAEKEGEIHAAIQRNVRVDFVYDAVDLTAFGVLVSGDVTFRGKGGRRGRGDEG